MAERTVRNPQVARHLGLRFSAALPQMHGFQLKFLGVRWSRFLHGRVLLWECLLSPIYSLHASGSRPPQRGSEQTRSASPFADTRKAEERMGLVVLAKVRALALPRFGSKLFV
jgi:hypothetical protein